MKKINWGKIAAAWIMFVAVASVAFAVGIIAHILAATHVALAVGFVALVLSLAVAFIVVVRSDSV